MRSVVPDDLGKLRAHGLVALATAVDGLLAGASLDQSIKQLPARQRIGVLAFSA